MDHHRETHEDQSPSDEVVQGGSGDPLGEGVEQAQSEPDQASAAQQDDEAAGS